MVNLSRDEKGKDLSRGAVHRIAHEVYDFADETVAHAEGVSREELMLECYHKLGTLLALWAKKLDKIERVNSRPLWLESYALSEEEKEGGRPLVDLGRETLGFEVRDLFFAREKRDPQLSEDLLMVSQPDSMWMEDFKELVRFCDLLGLDFYVDGFSTKQPGRTLRVVIYKPKDGPHKSQNFREQALLVIQIVEKLKTENKDEIVSKESVIDQMMSSGKFSERSSAEKLVDILSSGAAIPKLS